jgi:hypothetical protein
MLMPGAEKWKWIALGAFLSVECVVFTLIGLGFIPNLAPWHVRRLAKVFAYALVWATCIYIIAFWWRRK